MDSIDDVAPLFFKVRSEKDPEALKKAKQELYGEVYPRWCDAIEKRLQNNVTQKFLVGSKLTIADCSFAGRYLGMVGNSLSPFREDVEKLFNERKAIKTWGDNMEEIFKEYLQSRPKCSF